jgi:DNA-binding beta-propeller fold protein YncE
MTHVDRAWRASRMIRLLVLIILVGTATQAVLSRENKAAQTGTRQTTVIGRERLVSVEPLPQMDGQMCVYPADASPELIASLERENLLSMIQQQGAASPAMASLVRQQSGSATARTASGAPPRPSDAVRAAVAKRQPVSTVRDPRNAFAGLAIDPIRNEVIIAEENNFSILVYDRMENTPPRAALSEPKRVIQGERTYLEYACGVYVDPASGDIYGINNDTLNWMTVFDRNAKGDATPNRKLRTPHTTFGIVADEATQELLMTIQDDHAVSWFKKGAREQDAPTGLLQGPKTQMADPHGIALDPKSGLIFVTNWGTFNERNYNVPQRYGKPNWPVGRQNNFPGSGKIQPPSITVYRKDARGDVAPLRVIQGPRTLMNWPTSIAVHPDRGELFVANDTSDTITVYRTTDNGDVAPIRVIKGPRSMVKNPTGVALDLVNNELWVANFGNHSATVYPVDAAGDPAPKRIIRSGRTDEPSPMLSNPHTVAYDSKRDQLLVSN